MTAPLLTVDNLRIEARRSHEAVVDDISFEIARGEFLAVVGESGSGKTIAARSVLGLLPPGLRQTGGLIVIDGEDLAALSPRPLRALRGPVVGMVFQEPMMSLNPAISVGAQLAEGLTLHTRLPKKEIRQRCLDMLERVQIRDPAQTFDAYPHEFSGGMRQRIMLASVMLLRPKLLIADEPTTALDTLTQREVLDLMVGLALDHGTSVMLITHNLGLVARYTQRAVVLRKGKVIETGTTEQVLTAPRETYTRQLVEALPRRETRMARPPTGEPLMSVRGLTVEFGGRRLLFRQQSGLRAVDGVDLDIGAGETVAVVGGSGSGKTTLGRAPTGISGFPRNWCFRTPTRRWIPACVSARSSPNRCAMWLNWPRRSASNASKRSWTRSAFRTSRAAGRMNSRADNGSASPSRARSCAARASWSLTNRCPRLT
jgi:peptide/nickel transport system ATP-binding protein